jgi:pimeloyl-ACP methyl ester carboxylesterase
VPYATNALDGSRVYFEDDGGEEETVLLHGGLLDSVDLVRDSNISRALRDLPEGEFRLVYVDHCGLGRSEKPHDAKAYAMALRVADAVAVLDELGLERAHFVGASWGGRLGFGIGERAPERVLSLVIGGQQPYAMNPEGPLVAAVTKTLAESRREGSLEPFVAALESLAGRRLPKTLRARWLDNDPEAINAAWSEALAEGDISEDLAAWEVRCLIYVGAEDVDFHEQAHQAAREIPNARFVSLKDLEHVGAHLTRPDRLFPEILDTLHGNS